MTTGTRAQDFRITQSTSFGSTKVGRYYSINWSGTDWPKVKPSKKAKLVPRPPKRVDREDHAFSKTWYDTNDVLSRYFDTRTGYWQTCTASQIGYLPLYTDLWSSNDDITLVNKLRSKIAGSDFNLGVFLAEGKQALDMIFHSANRLAHAKSIFDAGTRPSLHGEDTTGVNWAKVEQALLGSRARQRKRVANSWLELQYGWLPLLSDMKAGAEAAAQIFNFPMETTYRVRHKVGGRVGCTASNGAFMQKSVVHYGQLLARIKEVNVPQLLGLTDPASVVWEKLPYSFIFDWAIPIGNWLSARGLSQALTGTFVTTHTVRKVACKPYFIRPPGVSWNQYILSDYTDNRGSCVRSVSTTLQVPFPNMVPLNRMLSWRRAANAVALVLQKRSPFGKLF